MGLDIYLTQKTFIGVSVNRLLIFGELKIFRRGRNVDMNMNRSYECVEYLGHRRKFYSFHWLVIENVLSDVSDCKEHLIDSWHLFPSLENCRTIWAQQKTYVDWQEKLPSLLLLGLILKTLQTGNRKSSKETSVI